MSSARPEEARTIIGSRFTRVLPEALHDFPAHVDRGGEVSYDDIWGWGTARVCRGPFPQETRQGFRSITDDPQGVGD